MTEIDPDKRTPAAWTRRCLGILQEVDPGYRRFRHGPLENTFRVDEVPVEAIVLNHLDVFLAERDRLNELVEIAERL